MREVLKWSKNHQTGEFITEKVIKENNGIIGKVNLYLLDKNGNLKQEVETHNIMYPSYHESEFYKNKFLEFAYASRSNYTITDQLNMLYLSDSNNNETYDDFPLNGKLIGYGVVNDTNAGVSEFKGSYDSNNSFLSKSTGDGFIQSHLVFEFGPTRANGKINSVGLTPSIYDYNNRMTSLPPFKLQYMPRLTGTGVSTGNCGYVFEDVKGEYYQRKSVSSISKYYKVKNLLRFVNGFEQLTTVAEPNENFNSCTFKCGNDKYVVMENHKYTDGNVSTELTTSFDLAIYNITDGQLFDRISFNDISEIIPDLSKYMDMAKTTKRVTVSMPVIRNNGDVILVFNGYGYSSSSTYPDGPSSPFPTWDNTGNITSYNSSSSIYIVGVYNVYSKKWVLKPSADSSFGHRLYEQPYVQQSYDATNTTNPYKEGVINKFEFNGVEYFSMKGYSSSYPYRYIMFNINNDYTINGWSASGLYNISENYTSNEQLILNCYVKELGIFMITNANTYFPRIIPHSSYTKLPSTIIKTSEDTLRIEYDYYIQVPTSFSPTGDYTTFPGNDF